MKTLRRIGAGLLALAAMLPAGAAARADAVDLIRNGGFESGLWAWTAADQVGSDGSFFVQAGATSPVNGFAVPVPPGGLNAAMTDAQAGGSHVLYQDFVVPTGVTAAVLRFDRYVNNQAGDFISPETLDWSLVANQQARVDLMLASADPFSVGAADILQALFRTLPGDPLVSGYVTIEVDVTALLAARGGETLRLRFASVDNQNVLNFGVDNVSLSVVPEPSALASLAVGGLLASGASWRRRSRPCA